jgi:WD domain, G-beta repeat
MARCATAAQGAGVRLPAGRGAVERGVAAVRGGGPGYPGAVQLDWIGEVGTFPQVLTGHDGGVWAVAVGRVPDGTPVIISGGNPGDGTVRVWRLADGTPVAEQLRGHTDGVAAVTAGALPDGTPVIVSGSHDQTVRAWRLADGTPVGKPLTGHDGTVDAVAVGALPDGTPVIVSGSHDQTVRAWRLADGTPLAHPLDLSESAGGIALHGNIIVTAAGPDIAVHRLAAPWLIRDCSLPSGHGRPTRPPDNGRLSGTSASDASTAMLMARNVHTSTCSPTTSGVGSDGFMNMSPVSTSGRQSLARDIGCYGERTSSGRDNRTFGAYRLYVAYCWRVRYGSNGKELPVLGLFSTASFRLNGFRAASTSQSITPCERCQIQPPRPGAGTGVTWGPGRARGRSRRYRPGRSLNVKSGGHGGQAPARRPRHCPHQLGCRHASRARPV